MVAAADDEITALSVARAAAIHGLSSRIYVLPGVDLARDPLCCQLRQLGAEVLHADIAGAFVQSDPRRDALAHWLKHFEHCLFVCSRAGGPPIFQKIMTDFHGIVGREIQAQCADLGVDDVEAVFVSRFAGISAFGLLSSYLQDNRVRCIVTDHPDQKGPFAREHQWLRETGLAQYRMPSADDAIDAQIAALTLEGLAVSLHDSEVLAAAIDDARAEPERARTFVLLFSDYAEKSRDAFAE